MKKIISILLTAILAIGFAIPTLAADASITADIVGYSDARVEAKDLSAVPSIVDLISGSEGKEFKISTAQELQVFSVYCNDGQGYCTGITIYLANDIDMTGISGFTPIGGGKSEAGTKPFRGIFDGQGYTIDNLTISYSGTQHVGLFGNIQGATIKNVIMGEGCKIEGGTRTAGIVGGVTGDAGTVTLIDNCWNKATIAANGSMTAGIVGYVSTTGTGSYKVDGTKATDADFAAGKEQNSCTVSNCTNTGSVTATARDAGGIVGTSNIKLTVKNCRNAGAVESKAMDKETRGTGGIVARFYATGANVVSEVSGCINNGTVTANKYKVGGIVGTADTHKVNVTDCKNFGAVTSTETAGGAFAIVANSVQAGNFTQSGNTGTTAAATDATLETALKADTLISKDVPTAGGDDNTNDDNTNTDEENNNNNENSGNTANTDNNGNSNTATDTTSAPADTTPDTSAKEEKGGCGSSVSCGLSVLAIIAGAGVVVCRKRN